MNKADIIVTGGGPAGMSAALEAASHGYSVKLVAPSPGRAPNDERTTALMMPAVAMLEKFGVWQSLEAHATPLKTMRIIDGSHRLIRSPTVTFDADEAGVEAFGYNIPNRELNRVLFEAMSKAPGIGLVDAMASSASFGSDDAIITLSNGETIPTKLAVAADGIHSTIREAAGIRTRKWSYPQTAVVLSFDHDREHGFTSTEFHTETGPFTQVPMAGKRSSLVWVVKPDEAERISGLGADILATEIERRMHSLLGKISNVSKPQCWPLSSMVAQKFGTRRLVLVGQAAHVFPPIGAQGLNLGLRDIAELGKCLSAAGADPGRDSITGRYDRIRKSDIATRTGAVDLLNRSLLTSLLPVQFARAAGLGILAAVPPLRGFMMREGMQPGAGFRHLFSFRGRLRDKDPAARARSS